MSALFIITFFAAEIILCGHSTAIGRLTTYCYSCQESFDMLFGCVFKYDKRISLVVRRSLCHLRLLGKAYLSPQFFGLGCYLLH